MRAGVDAVAARGRRASARPCRRASACLAVVGVDDDEAPRPRVVRRGREARGLDERVEHRARSTGSGRERADRPARFDERGNDGRRSPEQSSCGGRIELADRAVARTTPGRARARSRPGRPAALPITSSAAAAISSAIATSVTCSIAAERVGRVAQVDDRGDAAHADRDVGEPVPPRPAERVGDDHRDVDAAPGAQRVADVLGRAVGVDGEQRGPARRRRSTGRCPRSRTRSRARSR